MTGKAFNTLPLIAKHAKKQHALVAFNPSSYLAKQGLTKIKPLLRNTDILILNDEEASMLTGNQEHLKEQAQQLAQQGPETVVITQGSKGALVLHKKRYYEAAPKKNLRILETTGAGDAFGSTFLAARIQGYNISDSLRLALINAESVITNYGAKNILLDKQTIEQRLRKDTRAVITSTITNSTRSKRTRKTKTKNR